jgi:hypothetical protein
MAITLAQHSRWNRRERAMSRIIHVGILVCAGTPRRLPNVGLPPVLSHADLDEAVAIISRDVRIYRPFQIADSQWRIHYSFAFRVARTSSTVPVHSDISNPPPPALLAEGERRTGGDALREARRRSLENIAIVAEAYPGDPHGPCFDSNGVNVSVYPTVDGLQSRLSNAMIVGRADDLTSPRTAAHEVGHLLGLANAIEGEAPERIMGLRSPNRRLTSRDQELIHRAIERNLPGIRRPPAYHTAGSLPEYTFPGASWVRE